MKTALVAQCGGPTAVMNSTLAALVELWMDQGTKKNYRILGARFGLRGLMAGDWVDLSRLGQGETDVLRIQPGAALGCGRDRPADDEFPALARRLANNKIDAVFLIGGNGTMAAALKLEQAVQAQKLRVQVIGIPKTVDNDLAESDVAPGFGSAACYIANTTFEVGLDLRSLRGFDQVVVMEVMGRHTGWLAAAASVARVAPGCPPDVITLPEFPVEPAAVVAAVARVFKAQERCLVVVAEGTRNRAGRYWAELQGDAGLDPSGQRVFSMAAGAGAYLIQLIRTELKLRCRLVKPNSAQRASVTHQGTLDRKYAEFVAGEAFDAAVAGKTGVVPLLRCNLADDLRGQDIGPDQVEIAAKLVAFDQVAGREHPLPPYFIAADGLSVTADCTRFVASQSMPWPNPPLTWTEGTEPQPPFGGPTRPLLNPRSSRRSR